LNKKEGEKKTPKFDRPLLFIFSLKEEKNVKQSLKIKIRFSNRNVVTLANFASYLGRLFLMIAEVK
jgi:hypothetical protein